MEKNHQIMWWCMNGARGGGIIKYELNTTTTNLT